MYLYDSLPSGAHRGTAISLGSSVAPRSAHQFKTRPRRRTDGSARSTYFPLHLLLPSG